jgi:hypothetical protein
MKSLCFSLIILSSIAHADTKSLALWSGDQHSVQAVLFRVLETAFQLDAQSRVPQHSIIKAENKFIIQRTRASLACEKLGGKYRCLLKGRISNWTVNSDSVQAVLYDALETSLDVKSLYFNQLVKSSGSVLQVKDPKTSITCFGQTLGTEQVQSYLCTIK